MADDAYDDVPYTDHAYAESHPDRLAVIARLSGWEPAALEGARVLELGCGRGGNLLPMASSLPGATLVGVDRSRRQIDEARRIAREAGVANVTFHAASFEEADLAAGAFDFVVCHGVYSWVPVATRRGLLRVIARSLAPRGIAYVSFNTLPGWYERMAARDWLAFACGTGNGAEEPASALAWLEEQVCAVTAASAELRGYREGLAAVARRLRETDRAYAVHEYLAAEHHPETVSTFLGEAEGAGLSYLGDAIAASTSMELLPEAVALRARGMGVGDAQQLIDYVRCTSFRRALLVRADARWQPPATLNPDALVGLRLASRLCARDAELFTGLAGSVQVPDPATRRALHELARVAPRSRSFPDSASLVAAPDPPTPHSRRSLARELVDLWLAFDGLDLHANEPPIVTAPSQTPRACSVARWHAAHGGTITNLWHQEVQLAEPVVRFLLGRLDGTRTVAALVRDAQRELLTGKMPGGPQVDLEAIVRAAIDLLAASSLLVG